MNEMSITENIANGQIHYIDQTSEISGIKWEKHPSFKGVYMKKMITGAETGGLFSALLIKLDPESCLELHCHEEQMELHEVMAGDGTFQLLDKTYDYHLGKFALIPKKKNHMVRAGKSGLTLFAIFFPA